MKIERQGVTSMEIRGCLVLQVEFGEAGRGLDFNGFPDHRLVESGPRSFEVAFLQSLIADADGRNQAPDSRIRRIDSGRLCQGLRQVEQRFKPASTSSSASTA